MVELFPILTGCLISSAILVIEHLAFWPYKRLPGYLPRYALGTGALGIGMLVWAALTERLIAAVAFGAIAGCGLIVMTTAYWIRWQLARWFKEVDQNGFFAGQIAGQPLSEEHDGPISRSNPRSN